MEILGLYVSSRREEDIQALSMYDLVVETRAVFSFNIYKYKIIQ